MPTPFLSDWWGGYGLSAKRSLKAAAPRERPRTDPRPRPTRPTLEEDVRRLRERLGPPSNATWVRAPQSDRPFTDLLDDSPDPGEEFMEPLRPPKRKPAKKTKAKQSPKKPPAKKEPEKRKTVHDRLMAEDEY